MKRTVIALVLIIALVLCASVPAYAASTPLLPAGSYYFNTPEELSYFLVDGYQANYGELWFENISSFTFTFYGNHLDIGFSCYSYGMAEIEIDGQKELADPFANDWYSRDLGLGIHTVVIRRPNIENSNPMSYGSTDFYVTSVHVS